MAEKKSTNNDLLNTTQKNRIEQLEPHQHTRVNSDVPEGSAVPTPLVARWFYSCYKVGDKS